MKSTSLMTKMSFPFESVAFERIETLLTLGEANGKKRELRKRSINQMSTRLTFVSKDHVIAAKCFQLLFFLNGFQVERLLVLNHVVTQNVFREFRYTEGVKTWKRKLRSLVMAQLKFAHLILPQSIGCHRWKALSDGIKMM